ncbi:MAG TPA: hypothetical protein VFU21_21850 [Kofleriaceae bacterium]|nr:hypothetical protein [Kofleriaceae bacterium]
MRDARSGGELLAHSWWTLDRFAARGARDSGGLTAAARGTAVAQSAASMKRAPALVCIVTAIACATSASASGSRASGTLPAVARCP